MKSFKRFILFNVDIILFLIIITLKFLFYGSQIESNYFSYSSLLLPVLASGMLIVSLVYFFKIRSRARILFILNILFSILIICDLNYFRYFKDILSIAVIKNSILLGSVKSSIGSLFKLSDLLYLSDIIFLIPLFKLYTHKERKSLSFKSKALTFSVLLITGIMINVHFFYKLSIEQPRLITTMYNRIYISKKLGLLNSHGIDLYNSLKTDISSRTLLSKNKQEEIETFLQSHSEDSLTNLKGVAKGKNLIVIQVEALQQFAINNKIGDKEITPNLNKFINRSEYFDNYFYQISAGGTSDAEFLSNNSLYPSPSGAAYYQYYDNKYKSLPSALKNEGYETSVFHGFRESFWNRNVMYTALGFDNYYNEKDYNINETVGLGLSDKSFLNQTVDKLKTLQEPYYSFLITLSSHFPFDDTKGYGEFNVGEYENTLIGDYMKGIHYTDEQLGMFLNKLEEEGIMDNSIVVIYGDHSAISKDKQDQLAKFMNIDNMTSLQWAKLQKVPMLIHFPGDSHKGVNHIYSGQVDLYPTLANLFNLPNENLMGQDLFNSKEGKVIFRDGSFTDGNIFYIAQEDTYYNINTGESIPQNDTLKTQKSNNLKELEYSDDILKYDLLKKYDTDSKNGE